MTTTPTPLPDDPRADAASTAPESPLLEELHLRRLEFRAFSRRDGLFEVHARVTDRKSADFTPLAGGKTVPAGNAVHDLGVRVVFDEHLNVVAIGTTSTAHPYAECPGGGRALQAMVGASMTAGWSREVRARLGGGVACTHLAELLIPLASAAFQALSAVRLARPPRTDAAGRPVKIDSCYAYRADGAIVARLWPEHRRPASTTAEAHDPAR